MGESVNVVAAVVLGLAFLVAGASKIASGTQWPEQARGLRVPPAVIPLLPWLELALGATLVAQLARPVAVVVALVLLVAFTAVIAARLARGEHPPCACFGAWSAKPLGVGHLARNVALMVVAGLAFV